MANLTIRNLDDDVVDRLKIQAKRNHRSLEAEVRALLSATARHSRIDEFRARAREIREMTPKDVPQTDSVQLIREDRDR